MNKNQDGHSTEYNHFSNSSGVKQESLDFSVLMDKSLESELESKLQSSVVGGYSKKSVENFVAEMRNNLQHIKTQLERQVQDLSAEKTSVSQECSVLRNQLKTAEENLEEMRNQIINQQYRDETQCASEQEIQLYREENERLKGMLLDYQKVTEQRKKYESLLAQKEQEIGKLNATFDKFRKDYGELKERTEQLEKALNSKPPAASSEEEIAELKQQRDEITARYQTLIQRMEKTDRLFEQKNQHLDEKQTQLEQEKLRLDDARAQLEREKQNLLEAQTRLEMDIQKTRTLSQQLEKDQITVRQKEEEISGLITAKERIIDVLQREQEEFQWKSGDLEKKIETLYQQNCQTEDKIKLQDKIITEKDLLLEYYQQKEKESILMRQENEKSRIIISALQESLEQIMGHMDEQADGINRYIAQSLLERDALNAAVSERTALQLKNIEFMEKINCLSADLEKLEKKHTQLKKMQEQHKNTVMNLDNVKKIINFGDSDGQKSEGLTEPGMDSSREAHLKAKAVFQEIDKYNRFLDEKKETAGIS